MRAIRRENVQLVGTIEEKLKLVGMIECNLRSEMARHLKSIYDNDQLLPRTSQKYKLHNESLRDEYKLLNESLRDDTDENELLSARLRDNKDENELLLAGTRDDVNVSLIWCHTIYCDVHANSRLTLSTV